MLGLAGLPLGFQFRFLEPSADCPAARLGEVVHAPYDDHDGLERFALDLSIATYEFENVPAQTAEWLSQRLTLAPSAKALAIAQDRITEKSTFRDLGIPVQPFASISSDDDITRALKAVPLPAVLKTRRYGYDGKGQRVLHATETNQLSIVRSAWDELGRVPCILEAFVPFSAEVSMIAVRARRAGAPAQIEFYPLVQNEHRGGILWKSQAPAPCDSDGKLDASAREHVRTLMESLDYVGVIAVEFFVTASGLVANEMAPRVHNSGHWTIDGSVTSQFENHLRAIAGLPLGSTDSFAACAMINLVGSVPLHSRLLSLPGSKLHLYGKGARAGRKVGHVTLIAQDATQLARHEDQLAQLERLVVWNT